MIATTVNLNPFDMVPGPKPEGEIALHQTYLANLNSISCPLVVAKTPFLDNAAFWLVLKVGDDPAKQTSYVTA